MKFFNPMPFDEKEGCYYFHFNKKDKIIISDCYYELSDIEEYGRYRRSIKIKSFPTDKDYIVFRVMPKHLSEQNRYYYIAYKNRK